MKTITQLPHLTMIVFLAGGLALAACGSPDPIPVYVTPTPIPTATPLPPTPAPDTAGMVPVSAAPRQAGTPAATLPPGVNYGPIVGPEYTAGPLYTPLPNIPHERPCPAIVTAPQAPLHAAPQRTAESVGLAAERQQLTVREIYTDGEGLRWANTEAGWLLLSDGATQFATLGRLRSCAILAGEEPDTTLLGLHLLNWASQAQVLGLVKQLVDAGHPMGVLKGLTGAEGTLNEAKRISPQTVIIFRSIIHGFTGGDCPNADNDPIAEAREWVESLQRHWTKVNADYYEVINECLLSSAGNYAVSFPMEWLVAFSIEAMRIANEQGRCLLLFSFGVGTPEIAEFARLAPAFEYALEHPCQEGRYHGISLHAYGHDQGELVSETDDWLGYRHRRFYAEILRLVPGADRLPVYLTEVGPGNGYEQFSCSTIIRDIIQYTDRLQPDTYIKGFHLWTLGWSALDLTPCLGPLGDALVSYYTTR